MKKKNFRFKKFKWRQKQNGVKQEDRNYRESKIASKHEYKNCIKTQNTIVTHKNLTIKRNEK